MAAQKQPKITSEILKLKKRNQDLSPDDVLDYARRHPKSALYAAFERRGLWDDAVAAERARKAFARHLIIRVKVRVISGSGELAPVRALISLSEERDGTPSYAARADVLSNAERLARLKRDAAKQIESVVRMYADILNHHQIEDLRRMASEVARTGVAGGAGAPLELTAAAADR
jgi:hypothetical protein